MLKNLKVGTKLVAILVAPFLVLAIITYFGVKDRLNTASAANKVVTISDFAAKNADLAHQLELEGIYSAQYMASKGEKGRVELDKQREETNKARAEYEKAADQVKTVLTTDTQQGQGRQSSGNPIDTVKGRLTGLDTNRRSVDGLQTDPTNAIEQFKNATEGLRDANIAAGREIEDPQLARDYQTFTNLQSLTLNRAREAMLLVAADTAGGFVKPTGDLCSDVNTECKSFEAIQSAGSEADRFQKTYDDGADRNQKQLLRDRTAGNKYDDPKGKINNIPTGSASNTRIPNACPGDATNICPTDLVAASVDYMNKLHSAETALIQTINTNAQTIATNATRDAFLYLVGAVGAILIALIIAYWVARATTVPLKKLTTAAYTLSTDKLPALVERLRNPEEEGASLAETLTPIDISSKDEIGQLADAFNSIQQVTIEVAEEQAALLRKGIGDIFINLARRNQTLLDRQIEFIDQLEANEEDPDQLDNLFKLDHLATRMRRNAESLLVLAGAEPPRRRGRPVALADVVRVAIGEVEDFARIQLLALDDATVGGNVAVDLAHLLSELMENATHFSPPDTMVEIVGHRAGTEGYIISVSDQGIGMSADQLNEANTQLSRPPLVGLALSRSLGFIVIGRLAQRFDIKVKLTASPSGGVTALATLPPDIVTFEDDEAAAPPPAEGAIVPGQEPILPGQEPVGTAPPTDEPIVLEDDVVVVGQSADAADEDLLEELIDESPAAEPVAADGPALGEVPQGDEFDRGLQSLVSDELPAGPVESGMPGTPPIEPAGGATVEPPAPEAAPAPAPEPVAAAPEPAPEPAAPELTAAGLVRRTPKKKSAEAVGGGSAMMASRSSGQSQRSPEEVRKMLSRYRSGLNRGRTGTETENSDS